MAQLRNFPEKSRLRFRGLKTPGISTEPNLIFPIFFIQTEISTNGLKWNQNTKLFWDDFVYSDFVSLEHLERLYRCLKCWNFLEFYFPSIVLFRTNYYAIGWNFNIKCMRTTHFTHRHTHKYTHTHICDSFFSFQSVNLFFFVSVSL